MTDNSKRTTNLELALTKRAQASSAMPWLELKVVSQVEYREQAKQWLRTHPGGLAGSKIPARLRFWNALSVLLSSRSWQVFGVVLLTLGAAYLLLRLPLFAEATRTVQPVTLYTYAAALCVLAVALANWPRLRQFYG